MSNSDEAAARSLFRACDKDNDGYITRADLSSLCDELQLEDSVETLLVQLGADASGRISWEQFLEKRTAIVHGGGQPIKTTEPSRSSRPPPPNLVQLASTIHMSAVSSLQREIDALTLKLNEVTTERNQLQSGSPSRGGPEDPAVVSSAASEPQWEVQCQEYEERIVELHSVIAELSRKLDAHRDNVIFEEESEDDMKPASDSCPEDPLYEEDEDDYTSLAFERDLEQQAAEQQEQRTAQLMVLQEELHLAQEAAASASSELAEAHKSLEQMRLERDSYKRQLEDLKATVEYQEARMDSQSSVGSSGRSSSERRSLRRRRQTAELREKERLQTAVNGEPEKSRERCSETPSSTSSTDRLKELELEVERATSRADHARSAHDVLELSLADSKAVNEKLTVLLGKYESNHAALQLALNYCDHMIESYDVLVALLETEANLLSASQQQQLQPQDPRLVANRKSAEVVARHLLARMDKTFHRADSGIGGALNSSQHDSASSTCWEDSSGYSHTTSSTSSSHSHTQIGLLHSPCEFTKLDETRLREHISHLKTVRASIQASLADLEPLHQDPDLAQNQTRQRGENNSSSRQLELEQAVMQQEVMAAREEKADLRAKVYLLEKEKSNMELMMADRIAIEQVLRGHIQHLQEELGHVEQGLGPHRHLMSPGAGGRENHWRQRVQQLVETVDRVAQNSEVRQKQANELIEDLKRANSTLSEALEKSKKKYQLKLRKMEQQFMLQNSVSQQAGVSSKKSEDLKEVAVPAQRPSQPATSSVGLKKKVPSSIPVLGSRILLPKGPK